MSVVSEWWHDLEDFVDGCFDAITDILSPLLDWLRDELDDLLHWISINFPQILIAAAVLLAVTCIIATGNIVTAIQLAGVILAAGGMVIVEYWIAISAYIGAFLAAIHFSTLVAIHNVANILSAEYREFSMELWSSIAKWGAAIGLGAGFLVSVLQISRSLVMDVGALMGKKYDLAEIEWMQRLSSFLQKWEQFGALFAAEPGVFLMAVDAYFTQPYHNSKSEFSLNILSFIDATTKILDDTVPKLDKLRQDLEIAIEMMPDNISKPIYNFIGTAFADFDTFIDDKYTPVLENIKFATDTLFNRDEMKKAEIANLVDQLLHPASILMNVDKLDDIKRLEEQNRICEISNRALTTESEQRNKAIDREHVENSRVFDALTAERESPDFLNLEYNGPKQDIKVKDSNIKSWQVGDY